MRKIILTASVASMLLIPSARYQSDNIAKADSISLSQQGYFYNIEKDGFIDKETFQDEYGYYSFEELGFHSLEGNINNVSYDYTFINDLFTHGRLNSDQIVWPGQQVNKVGQHYMNNAELPLVTFYDVLSPEDLETPEHLYFHAYQYSRDVFVPFKEDSKQVSIVFSFGDVSFGDYTPINYPDYENYLTGGLRALINFLDPLMNNGETISLLEVNETPIARLTKMNDSLKLETNSSVNAYLTTDYQYLCVDLPNPGVITQISGLEVSEEFGLEEKNAQFLMNLYLTPPTYATSRVDTPLFLEDYDHLNGELIFVKNNFSTTWKDYVLKSINIDGEVFEELELINSFTDWNYGKDYCVYKIRDSINRDLSTHDFKIENITLRKDSIIKVVDGLNYNMRYINNDVHHVLAVDVSIDHWCDYSKIWFRITDLQAKARILLGMTEITFGYYELNKEWEKDNAKDLIRSVHYSREENQKKLEEEFGQKFETTAELYEFLNKKIPSYMAKSKFIDQYGREWVLKYVKNDSSNQFEQSFSGSGKNGFDWELYTNKPGNLVYFDPELSVIYVNYTTTDGETIKCSSYKDGRYSELIDGQWIVKDIYGNIIEGAGVTPDGIIYDEASGVLWKSPTTNTSQSFLDDFNNLLAKIFTRKNITKMAIFVLTIGVIALIGYGAYKYLSIKTISKNGGNNGRKK